MARDLERLAAIGWRLQKEPRDIRFQLDPSCLPVPTTAHNMTQVVGLLYQHARQWVAGFEVPFHVPKVRLRTADVDPAAGKYRVDEEGFVSIEVDCSLLPHPESILAVLAHEACHHILDLSGLNSHEPMVDEPLTDLAIFICGFGQVFMNGRKYLASINDLWCTTHLGYLTDEQYAFACRWVLQTGKEGSKETSIDSDSYHSRYMRQKLLNKLGGNVVALDRLLARERLRQPGYNDLLLYDAISEQIERDQRG